MDAGSFAAALGNLTQLIYLDLSSMLSAIPSSIEKLEQLTHFSLSKNPFTGMIPVVFVNLGKLEMISCNNNVLSGHLTFTVLNLNQLLHLDFSMNQLLGRFPADSIYNWGIQNSLNSIFSFNSLNVTIPSWCFICHIYRFYPYIITI